MNRIVLYLVLMTFPSFAFDQSNDTYHTELYGPQTYNPASYGTWNRLSVNTTFRNQFADRSLNNTIEAKTKIGRNSGEKLPGFLGLGASYTYVDGSTGSLNNSHFINFNLNYQFPVGKSFLSVGVAPGFSISKYDASWWASEPMEDQHFTLGAGIQWYTRNLYVGIYGSDLLAREVSETGFHLPRYYIDAAYRLRIRRKFSLLPTLKYSFIDSFHSGSALLIAEIDKAHLRLGVGYEFRSALLFTVSTYFKHFELSYNFGLNSSGLSDMGWNTHEIRFSYRLPHQFPPRFRVITTPPF